MSWIDEDTEAAHLEEIYGGEENWDEWDQDWAEEEEERRKELREERKRKFEEKRLDGVNADEEQYKKNKEAKVGTSIKCAGPLCHRKFKKIQYAQCFCSNHCKDQFWNRREAVFGYRKKID